MARDSVSVRVFGDNFAASLEGMERGIRTKMTQRIVIRSAQLIQTTVQTKTIKRGGKGKPLAAKLTSRSGTLRRGIHVNVVSKTAAEVGTHLVYGPPHEQGGNLSVRAHKRKRQTVAGRSVAFVRRGTVLSTRTHTVKAHKRFVPRRPFLEPAVVLSRKGMSKIMREELLLVTKNARVVLPPGGRVPR